MDAKILPDASMAANYATVGVPVVEALSLRPLFISMLFISLCVTILVLNRSKLTKFPDVTVATSMFDIGNSKARRQFVFDSIKLIKDGFAEASGLLNSSFSFSSNANLICQFLSDIPGFEIFKTGFLTSLVTDVTRVKITQSLEKKEFVLKSALLDLVARISSRVFLGDVGCRNPAWLNITKEFTVNSFMACVELRKYPPGIRHIVHWFLPECKTVRVQGQMARNIINDILEARQLEDKQRLAMGLKAESRNDAIEWFDQMAKGHSYDVGRAQIALAMAAVHTTTDLLTQTLFDIMDHPQLIPVLREEIVTVINQDGWEKTALYKLKLMDSVVKESQRIKPPNVVSMNRLALKDVKLPDGSILPAGSKMGVSAHSMWDPSVHPDPKSWDGYRWLRKRQQVGQENLHQLATTSPQHIAFGHGKHSCPGRFFAANEIKIALCFLIMNYEFELTPGVKPEPVLSGIQLDSSPTARVQVRRREPELDLLSLLKRSHS
ncbi:hypothetical protein CaCOL14_012230 [Colletotrichum acutatum]